MTSHHINYTRWSVGSFVNASLYRTWTEDDDTPRKIIRHAFWVIRQHINRGRTLDEALRHIDGLTLSASLV